jgi:large repetitive protein
VVPGDGCNGQCKVETNWTCPKAGSCKRNVICGDGSIGPGEVCDYGNTLPSDGCSGTCTIEKGYLCPFPNALCVPNCGDGIVLAPMEQCDPAAACTNMAQACSSTCKVNDSWVCAGSPPSCHQTVCGDGKMEGSEGCDNGNTNAGDGCSATCTVEPGFQCAPANVDAGVASACGPICGDGVVQPGEQCDYGAAKNLGGYGQCSADCHLGPYCGDGKVTDGEECDNGKNDDDYGASNACGPGCKFSPRSGDGIVQTDFGEACDDGSKNVASTDPSVGYGQCMSNCKRGGFCGDGVVNGFEGCDDGANDGTDHTCNPDCTTSTWCGDGLVQPEHGEECEPLSSNDPDCLPTCRLTPACILNPYPYCGDGIVNGPEECDHGADNGKDGVCRADCRLCICP